MCRQFIREFCGNEMKVFMYGRQPYEELQEQEEGKKGNIEVKTLGELLPMSFGPDGLKDGQGRGAS
jgi:cytidine deaminase